MLPCCTQHDSGGIQPCTALSQGKCKDHAEPRNLYEMTSSPKKDERLTVTKNDPSSIAMSVRDNPLQDYANRCFLLTC